VNHLQAGLIFAGIPLAVVIIVFVLVFTLSDRKPPEQPSTDDHDPAPR
jgi:hypothetical protein